MSDALQSAIDNLRKLTGKPTPTPQKHKAKSPTLEELSKPLHCPKCNNIVTRFYLSEKYLVVYHDDWVPKFWGHRRTHQEITCAECGAALSKYDPIIFSALLRANKDLEIESTPQNKTGNL
jgi:hypothetical protein